MGRFRIDSRDGAMANDWRNSAQKWESKYKEAQKEIVELKERLLYLRLCLEELEKDKI